MGQNGPVTKEISPKQARAVAMLLESKTVAEAAEKAGVGARTIRRWMAKDTAFISELRAARTKLIEDAVRRTQVAAEEAVEALEDCLDAKMPPTVRLRAALVVLERAFHGVEIYDHDEKINLLLRGEEERNNR